MVMRVTFYTHKSTFRDKWGCVPIFGLPAILGIQLFFFQTPHQEEPCRTDIKGTAEPANLAIIERLLDSGTEVNALATGIQSRKALQAAIKSGHLDDTQ
jgi:hypothetical protein